MPPKPFPTQFRIGTDIIRHARIRNILYANSHTQFLNWGSKTFNRREWPQFYSKCKDYFADDSRHDPDAFERWLSGRWAAKEAAIKAHSNRRLTRLQVSIVPAVTKSLQDTGLSTKPSILIDPPARSVLMSSTVAKQRGLGVYGKWSYRISPDDSTSLVRVEEDREVAQGKQFHRRLLVKEEDQQLADVSISHDGEYAVAVCMAIDDAYDVEGEPIIDDGEGEPMHEPEWLDEGFLGHGAHIGRKRFVQERDNSAKDTASRA